jgi:hypothetical protein
MTQDEIIEIAKQAWISEQEAQLITEFDMAYISCTYLTDLVAFAKLVAAKEREACAKVAEDCRFQLHISLTSMPLQNGTAVGIANRIRARAQADRGEA